jgi:ribosomal protein S18 acetylase RimI-like enzyme
VSILYRPARAEDLQRAGELVAASINALCRRHGFAPMAAVRPPTFATFSLEDNADGLWVAEDAGAIVGFASSWVCGDLWFLAQLCVSPDRQGRGIGPALLERTLAHAQNSNARTRALVTFAFNTVSQGLYMRHGLFPRCPIYHLQIARAGFARGRNGERLNCVPFDSTAAHLSAVAEIDAAALAVSRSKHHRFLLAHGEARGFLFHTGGGERVGYAYVTDGHVGPLAVTRRPLLGAAFRTALELAAEGRARRLSAFVPGPCDAALAVALAAGMRITHPMLLMATRDFGNWAQYLPRNPGFM